MDRKINQYIAKVDGIVKKMENDKYFIVFKKQYFKQLEEDKFSLLEDVKSVNIGNGIPATLSIGLGLSCDAMPRVITMPVWRSIWRWQEAEIRQSLRMVRALPIMEESASRLPRIPA